jgi:catechol 2,3-dioxygenase-like lactoylglutathione lyase family enzyme
MALFDAHGIDRVAIRYRDLPRAVAWFRDVLGLHMALSS